MKRLSGYRIMWVMALFDLPVGTKAQRRRATGFRNFLLDEGFEMVQFSVYVRPGVSQETLPATLDRIRAKVPKAGKVDVVSFTDKQYGRIVSFRGPGEAGMPKNDRQLRLF